MSSRIYIHHSPDLGDGNQRRQFHPSYQLTLQKNGRLVILGQSLNVVWNSCVPGKASVKWVLTVDVYSGNLAVVDLLEKDASLL